MSWQTPNRTFVAAGTVNPAVFATLTTSDFLILNSVSGDSPIGVTDTQYAQYNVSYSAVSGQSVAVFGPGQECWLTLGSGGCTANQGLKPDASGYGIVASTTNKIGAVSLEGGASGDLIRVRVTPWDQEYLS